MPWGSRGPGGNRSISRRWHPCLKAHATLLTKAWKAVRLALFPGERISISATTRSSLECLMATRRAREA